MMRECMTDPISYSPDDEPRALGLRATGAAPELFGPVPRTHEDLRKFAAGRTRDGAQREQVLAQLTPYWESLTLGPAGQDSLRAAQDPRCEWVITGQQPALAGGPLHLFVKAISVARLASAWRAVGVPCVPLFWIADEDHDAGELFPGGVVAPDGSFRAPPFTADAQRVPVADRRFDSESQAVLAWLRTEAPQAAPYIDRLEQSFDPSPSVWFRDLLLDFLNAEGILPVVPGLLRQLQSPWLRQELEQPGMLREQVAACIEDFREWGLEPPIPQAADLPFFWISDSGRHRLQVDAETGDVQARDSAKTQGAASDWARRVAESPESFSPDALLRPLLQDRVLEPLANVVGPTELVYHLQLARAYEAREIPRPLLMPRLRVRIVEAEDLGEIERQGLSTSVWTQSGGGVEEQVPSPKAEAEVDALVAELRPALEAWERWQSRQDAPSGLQKRAQRVHKRWEQDLAKFSALIRRDFAGDVEEARRCVQRVRARLFPGGKDGERTRSVIDYLQRHGSDLWQAIGDAYDPFDATGKVLILDGVSNG